MRHQYKHVHTYAEVDPVLFTHTQVCKSSESLRQQSRNLYPSFFLKHLLWHPPLQIQISAALFQLCLTLGTEICLLCSYMDINKHRGRSEKRHLKKFCNCYTNREREETTHAETLKGEEDEYFNPEMVTWGSGHCFLKVHHPITSAQCVTW